MKAKIVQSILFAIGLVYAIHIFSYGGPVFYYYWHSIDIGDTKEEVLAKLGTPFKESDRFAFWDMVPYEKNAKLSGSVTYVTWIKSIDIGFVVGFDKNQQVSYKVSGGS